jgi:hypothetical protein
MRKFVLLLTASILTISASSENYKFRIHLKDKGKTSYSISKPEEFLSSRAIERRAKQAISINISDLPISDEYVKEIEKLNCQTVAKSKWLKTITIQCDDSSKVEEIKKLDFVKDIEFVWKSDTIKIKTKNPVKRNSPKSKLANHYGYASDQITTLNGQYLHEKGFKGEDMEIAIIDAGYSNLQDILFLDNVFIKGTKDFVPDGNDMFESSEHGLNVLSAMATNIPDTYAGTAPKAKYWLLRSEDSRSEFPVEEDYWIAAIEYADSVGVDLVNTSLGYNRFDFPAKSYTHEQLDGKTSLMTRAAEIATTKGIFVVVSAGNEGSKKWEKITVPADAEHVLTVGSMTRDSIISSFSSIGPTADGRVKPDVVALGDRINLIGSTGDIIINSGTSFAGPVMCGLAACLWQAYPELTNLELLDIIKKSSSKYKTPGTSYGYGIPDMKYAMSLAEDISTGIEEDTILPNSQNFQFISDSIGHIKIIKLDRNDRNTYNVIITSMDGKVIVNDKFEVSEKNYYIDKNIKQAYIINIFNSDKNESKKILF